MCYLYLHWQISRTFGNALRATIIYILPDFLFYFISVSVPMHYYLRQRPFWIISYSLSFTFEACNLHIKTLINSKVLMVSQWYIKLKYVGYRKSIARLWYLLPNVFFFHTELYTDIGHKGACWSTSFLDCITIIIKRTVYKDMGKYLNFKAKTFGSFFVNKNILYLNKSNLRKIL